jgi:hypothetical protein
MREIALGFLSTTIVTPTTRADPIGNDRAAAFACVVPPNPHASGRTGLLSQRIEESRNGK